MLKVERIGDGTYKLSYLDKELVLKIYVCAKRYEDLDDELQYRGVKPEQYTSLVPETAVYSNLQVIFAALATLTYGEEYRVKNRGLLFAMFLIGEDQISTVTSLLREGYKASSKYYLITLERDLCCNTTNCHPVNLLEQKCDLNVDVIEKNLDMIIRRF